MGPGKGILGHGGGHEPSVKNGLWAGAGSPCVFLGWGGDLALVSWGWPRAGRRSRAWGMSGEGAGLGEGCKIQ